MKTIKKYLWIPCLYIMFRTFCGPPGSKVKGPYTQPVFEKKSKVCWNFNLTSRKSTETLKHDLGTKYL